MVTLWFVPIWPTQLVVVIEAEPEAPSVWDTYVKLHDPYELLMVMLSGELEGPKYEPAITTFDAVSELIVEGDTDDMEGPK
mmetsp:Transcript_7705/g.12311  ORF Transcript_7705/g.12311 Transcript_7705/m.12311 type:complete len:81 (+) Transcript_7705:21792-22034(+)